MKEHLGKLDIVPVAAISLLLAGAVIYSQIKLESKNIDKSKSKKKRR